jgi:hypothetical protein
MADMISTRWEAIEEERESDKKELWSLLYPHIIPAMYVLYANK